MDLGYNRAMESPVEPVRESGPPASESPHPARSTHVDRFTDDRPAGQVIGTAGPGGPPRLGADVERVIAIDNGALRMQPLRKSGWARCAIAYGPYERANGLAFAVFMLNGHNTSQAEALPDGLRMRFERWALGAGTERPLARVWRLLRGRQRRHLWRRLLQWIRTGSHLRHVPPLDDNLAVGWFGEAVPTDPVSQGNGFIMHALGPECGDLRARAPQGMSVVRGVQNVPLYLLVVLRERGAAYYAAAVEAGGGFAAFPRMRPLAIDPDGSDARVYAAIHQSVLGQIGFRVDTRVYAAQVATLRDYSHWFGSAHAADLLAGSGSLHGSAAAQGGPWRVFEGASDRMADGAVARGDAAAAWLSPAQPSGLLHARVALRGTVAGGFALVWRYRDARNHWRFEVTAQGCRLAIMDNGVLSPMPWAKGGARLAPGTNSIQVLDDGQMISLAVNAETAYAGLLADTRLAAETGVGFRMDRCEDALALESFEAHPRDVPCPSELALDPLRFPAGDRTAVQDAFTGPPGDLAGHTTAQGGRTWSRCIGGGRLQLTGDGAVRVDATAERPCPGRTIYTIDWHEPACADVAVAITAPPPRPAVRERGRGGLVFWQDPGHFFIVSVWTGDPYGTSISSFYQVDGAEELYDAVWTNVGRRIRGGVPFTLRVAFDGTRFVAYVDGEPVLYRALADVYPDWRGLAVRKIGLVANWEWGTDTGSSFRDFVARDRG